MKHSQFSFANVVMVEDGLVGIVVKSWEGDKGVFSHDVYVRSFNSVKNYKESEMRHFIFDKELSEEDMTYY